LTARLPVRRPPPALRSPTGSALAPTWVHSCPRPRSGSPWTSARRLVSASAWRSTWASTHRRSWRPLPTLSMLLLQNQTDLW